MRQVPCLHKFKIQQRRQILSKSMLKRLSDFSCEEWIRSEWWGVISGDAYLVWRAARLILVRSKATLKPVADLVNRKGKRWERRRHFRERPVCANTHRQRGGTCWGAWRRKVSMAGVWGTTRSWQEIGEGGPLLRTKLDLVLKDAI